MSVCVALCSVCVVVYGCVFVVFLVVVWKYASQNNFETIMANLKGDKDAVKIGTLSKEKPLGSFCEEWAKALAAAADQGLPLPKHTHTLSLSVCGSLPLNLPGSLSLSMFQSLSLSLYIYIYTYTSTYIYIYTHTPTCTHTCRYK